MVAPVAQPLVRPFAAVFRESSFASKVLLVSGAAVGCAICWWAAKTFGIPPHRDGIPSLLLTAGVAVNLLVLLGCVILSALAGTLIAGRVRFDAGLFAAAVGVLAISVRGGTVGDALRSSAAAESSPGLLLKFAAELVALYAILAVGWAVLWVLHRLGWLQHDAIHDELEDVDESMAAKLTALAAQLIFTGLATMLLLQSDGKAQAIMGIATASFLATLASHSLFPVRPSVWFWTAPLVIGVASYLWADASSPEWRIGIIGVTGNVFGPWPARAMPIDFAGAGTAGTLVGYWLSRKFHRGNMLEAEDLETV